MNDYEYFMEKANAFHGHVCGGIALGIRTSLAAMKALGLDPHQKHKNIIVYTEVDRCMTDAIMVVTGCSPGRRSLKLVDYGRFAMTMINLDTGKALRGTIKMEHRRDEPIEDMLKRIAATSDEDLINLQEVKVDIPENDLPGKPRRTAVCSVCGERIMDGRDCLFEGKTLCRGCLNGTYYTEI